MKESKSNTILNRYFRETRHYCYYELKEVKGKKFHYSKIETNQDEGLPALSKEGLVWKLSDEDSRRKPCDGFCSPPLPAYLILKWDKAFYLLNYSAIRLDRDLGGKDLTKEEALALAEKVIHIR